MDVEQFKDEIERHDVIACTISWVLVCLYSQIVLTYIAVVRTTFFYHCLFMVALTALFLSLLCLLQGFISPRYIYIINDKE